MGKIGERQKDVANLRAKRPHFLMGSLQEFLEHAELMRSSTAAAHHAAPEGEFGVT